MDEASRLTAAKQARVPAREILGLLKDAAKEWMQDNAPRLAAALAYYALFSITPILLISIAVAGVVFGPEAARGEVLTNVRGVVGESAGKSMEDMIANAGKQERASTFAVIVGFVMLLFGASGVFNQLKDTLNAIWEIPPKKGGAIMGLIRQRFLSFAMVTTVGFLLLVSLVLSALLSAAGKFMESRLPGGEVFWQLLNFSVSVAIITVLFAMIYRYVPDQRIPWQDVWVGAFFTSILFALGKFGIGFYLGKSSTASAFGAAGSIVIILIWLYYSSMIVFFGAEFTEVYARRRHEGRRGDRPRSGRKAEELIARVHTEGQAGARGVAAASSAARIGGGGGSGKAAVLTGCGGLLVGMILGAVTAIVGVVVTAIKSVTKKLLR